MSATLPVLAAAGANAALALLLLFGLGLLGNALVPARLRPVASVTLVTALALVQRKGPPLLTGLALGASLATKLTLAPGAVALGLAAKEEYLGRTIPGYRAAAYVNELPPGEVMAGDFPGPVYFDRPWIVEGLINEAPLTLWIRNGETADRPLARLHENGIRWLLATPAFGGGTPLSLLTYAPDPSKAHVMAALRSRLRFVATVDRVDVWEVPAPSRSGKP